MPAHSGRIPGEARGGRNRMRVLYVDTAVGLGGGQTNLIVLLGTLDRDHVTPIVAAPAESEVARWCSSNNVELIPLPFRTSPDRPVRDLFGSLYGVFLLALRITSMDIDLVHVNTFKAGLVVCMAAVLAGRPCIYHEQALKTHGALDALVARLSSIIVAVSGAAAEKHLPRFEDKVTVVPTGVDTRAFSPDDLARPTGAVCFAGRIADEKGIDILVECAPEVIDDFPRAGFIVCGAPFTDEDRAYERRIQRRIDELGLASRFEFTGFIRDVREVLRRSDLLVLPSRREALPKIVMEAMAMGKPVVAARVGGLPDLVSDGKSGLLVRPESPDELADALLKLLRAPALARSMGREGRRIAEERYGAEAATAAIVGVYRGILDGS
ncbi:MAG: glycosyltransferase [bacterium]